MTTQTARTLAQGAPSQLRAAWGRTTYRRGTLLVSLVAGMTVGGALLGLVGVAPAFALAVGAVVISDLAALNHSWTLIWREHKHARLDALRLALGDEAVVANAVAWGWWRTRPWVWCVMGARLLVVVPTIATMGREIVFRPYPSNVLAWQATGVFTGGVMLVLALLFVLEPLLRGRALVRLGVAVSAGAVNRVVPVLALVCVMAVMLVSTTTPLVQASLYRNIVVFTSATPTNAFLVARAAQVLVATLVMYSMYVWLGRVFVRRTVRWLRVGGVK